VKRLQREMDAAAKASLRQDTERQALANTSSSAQAELEDVKKRLAAASESFAKGQAETKRLQSYVKHLEAAQRLKDSQVQTHI
jgi:hypothetical protein